MIITARTPMGLTLVSVSMKAGASGSWSTKSPEGTWYMYGFRFVEPSDDALVTGIWLGAGRDNELDRPVHATALNELFSQNVETHWTEPLVTSLSTVRVQIEGRSEFVTATFTSRAPRLFGLRSVPPSSKEIP